MPKRKIIVSKRVNFIDNAYDWKVVQLAQLGAHQQTIAKITGLSLSQVRYRTKQADVKTRAYRDGITPEFKRVWSLSDEIWSEAKATAARKKADTNSVNLLEKLREARASRHKK